jgi:hypothetical protein
MTSKNLSPHQIFNRRFNTEKHRNKNICQYLIRSFSVIRCLVLASHEDILYPASDLNVPASSTLTLPPNFSTIKLIENPKPV